MLEKGDEGLVLGGLVTVATVNEKEPVAARGEEVKVSLTLSTLGEGEVHTEELRLVPAVQVGLLESVTSDGKVMNKVSVVCIKMPGVTVKV